ncbi:hypothetical protein AB6D20_027860 (plasmid) [Vibrio splendidus]
MAIRAITAKEEHHTAKEEHHRVISRNRHWAQSLGAACTGLHRSERLAKGESSKKSKESSKKSKVRVRKGAYQHVST